VYGHEVHERRDPVSRKIYKFRAYPGASTSIPGLVKVLLFGPQGAEGLFVWAEVLDGGVTATLDVLPTGATVRHDAKHWASCQDGEYVWHLYERLER
jgi:hypothetical protein